MEVIIDKARELLKAADALLIGAGTGIGLDSGLPDFCGSEEFWEAYPQFQHLGLLFKDLTNPKWFHRDSKRAWGFYGYRLNLYRKTEPHQGFTLLKQWADQMSGGAFVFTSNVDGQFQRAGFSEEQVVECHGSIHYLQCNEQCCSEIWSGAREQVTVDIETLRARGAIPLCPHCQSIARPNILMFGDNEWISRRSRQQENRYIEWLQQVQGKNLVVIELGTERGASTVQYECEAAVRDRPGNLIRINSVGHEVPDNGLSLAMSTQAAMEAIGAPR